MTKIIATIVKEWRLMKRDVSGLLLLLVMPAVLMIVMALVQDAPFKDYSGFRFDMLVSDNDHGKAASEIIAGLKQSRNFHVVDSLGGMPVNDRKLLQLLRSGEYSTGIIIPPGITAELANAANIVVNNIASKAGISVHIPSRAVRPASIRLCFDPVSKPSMRAAISLALDKYVSYTCNHILVQRLSLLNTSDHSAADTAGSGGLQNVMQCVSIAEAPLNDDFMRHVNSVQHNVPAWAIFGMFFIIIPIAGHSIKEREDGSALRVSLIPNATHQVTFGKILFYTLVCMVQFMIMLAIGLWAMPLFSLPELYPGQHAWLLLPVAVCIGFAATACGFLIGASFKTINQALPFASISIVILSAIGGIWVPVEILPHTMQKLALVSPLHWSLYAVNQVILRDADFNELLKPVSVIMSLGIVFWVAGALMQSRKR